MINETEGRPRVPCISNSTVLFLGFIALAGTNNIYYFSVIFLLRPPLTPVVSKMGILARCDKMSGSTINKSKIPDYARGYKKEYLFIRGINNNFDYILKNLDYVSKDLFLRNKTIKIKEYIKQYDKAIKRCLIKNISFYKEDVNNICEFKKRVYYFLQYLSYRFDSDVEDDVKETVYPGLLEFNKYFELFLSDFSTIDNDVSDDGDDDVIYSDSDDSDDYVIYIYNDSDDSDSD